MADDAPEPEEQQHQGEEQPSPRRLFLRHVGLSLGSIASNPRGALRDSLRLDERERDERD